MSGPRTVWEDQDGVASGGSGLVRGAAFPAGGIDRGAVTLTVRVPDSFATPIEGGGTAATILLTPNEARGFAAWLDQAAAAADQVGPPLYE